MLPAVCLVEELLEISVGQLGRCHLEHPLHEAVERYFFQVVFFLRDARGFDLGRWRLFYGKSFGTAIDDQLARLHLRLRLSCFFLLLPVLNED